MEEIGDILESARTAEEARIQRQQVFRLSREERDYIANHALDSMNELAASPHTFTKARIGVTERTRPEGASDCARKIAALSNLLGNIGWEREAVQDPDDSMKTATPWFLGELFPTAQLRPWLEEWVGKDKEALAEAERELETVRLRASGRNINALAKEPSIRKELIAMYSKLGEGAILATRLERWIRDGR